MTAKFERKETMLSGARIATIFELHNGDGGGYIGLSFNNDRKTKLLVQAWRAGWNYNMLAQEIPPDIAYSLLHRLSTNTDMDDLPAYSHIVEIPAVDSTISKIGADEWRAEEMGSLTRGKELPVRDFVWGPERAWAESEKLRCGSYPDQKMLDRYRAQYGDERKPRESKAAANEVSFARGFDYYTVVLNGWVIADIKPIRPTDDGKFARVMLHGILPNPKMTQTDYKSYDDAMKAVREFYTTGAGAGVSVKEKWRKEL